MDTSPTPPSKKTREKIPTSLRVWKYLFPPVAFFQLWKGNRFRRSTQIKGSIVLILHSVIYGGLVIWGLSYLGIELYEWRGGYMPTPSLIKTVPDYEKLESHRQSFTAPTSASANTPTSTY